MSSSLFVVHKIVRILLIFSTNNRFDPNERETDGVDCKINVEVAEVGEGSWALKSEPGG